MRLFSLTNFRKLPVNEKNHIFVSNKICVLSIISNVTNNKKELRTTVRLTSFQKPKLLVHQCFFYYLLCYLYVTLTYCVVILIRGTKTVFGKISVKEEANIA